MVAYTPMLGAMKISNNAFQVGIMKLGRACGELGKGGDSVGDVRTATCLDKHEFAKDGTIGESHRVIKGLMGFGTFFGAAR